MTSAQLGLARKQMPDGDMTKVGEIPGFFPLAVFIHFLGFLAQENFSR
jgi:thioredoxin-related protein